MEFNGQKRKNALSLNRFNLYIFVKNNKILSIAIKYFRPHFEKYHRVMMWPSTRCQINN